MAATGCGGGGGGSNSGSGGGTTRATLTIDWPQRARSVAAPESALSAVVTITGGGAGGSDLSVTFNRDTTKPDAYSGSYSANVGAAPGQYTVTVRFYSQPNGSGSVVGTAQKRVSFTGGTADLGDVTVAGTVASVVVAPGQSLSPGQSSGLVFTTYDANGAAIASLSPASAFYSVTAGASLVTVANGILQANDGTSGLAQVTVTVDGKTSAPQAVGVGSATIPVSVLGSRGSIPIADTLAQAVGSAASSREEVGTSFTFQSGWFQQNTLSVPAGYGDVQFNHWEQKGQPVGASPTLAFTPDGAAGAPLNAVYTPRPMPAGGFTPSYNQPDNVAWDHFPLNIYFDISDSGIVSRVKKGFDRWVNATGGAISYVVVTDPAQADVTVSLGNKQLSPTEKAVAALGGTTVTTNGVPVTTLHGTISILSTAPGDPLQNGVDPLEVLAAHELGHVLGIFSSSTNVSAGTESGHSPDPNDTMYSALNVTTANAITERDINTLENLYPGLFNGSRAAVPARRRRE